MKQFITQLGDKVIGVLEGFDRLLFRGTLLRIVNAESLRTYLQYTHILLKDFKSWSLEATAAVRSGAENMEAFAGRPNIYLNDPKVRKEEFARKIAEQDKIEVGPVCIIRASEPCWSFELHRDREQKKLILQPNYTKCLHIYHYQIHPEFGLMHTRLQTWLPFGMRVYINGRAWLERQLIKAGIKYQRSENCFPAIDNIEAAQELCVRQLTTNWTSMLDSLQKQFNPAISTIFKKAPLSYYWSLDQSEWATDIMFKNADSLTPLYERLLRHAMTTFKSDDVMRFLGRRVATSGRIYNHFQGEIVTDLKRRQEGVRIKHKVKENSIKMYNKQGSVLRVETTINNPKDFKVLRLTQKGKEAKSKKLKWRTMRKGVADIKRRADICSAANSRYLDALAPISVSATVKQVLAMSSKPTTLNNRTVRAINPFSVKDFELLETLGRGEFRLNGFRNRDLQAFLYTSKPDSKKEYRSRSAAVSRKLRLLRAHGLITRINKTYRYRLTKKGEQLVSALTHSEVVNCNDFMKLAA